VGYHWKWRLPAASAEHFNCDVLIVHLSEIWDGICRW
jgi:hypothetical protein